MVVNQKASISVEVVYASEDKQMLVSLNLAVGSTALEAIQSAHILELFPEIGDLEGRVGIFGKLVCLDVPLKEGDRVEIYRALKLDPKEARRVRAKMKK